MGLTCECPEWDGDGRGYAVDGRFSVYKGDYKGEYRYCNCGKDILPGATVLRILEFEPAEGAKDYLDLVYFDPEYLCETCGEIFLNLEAAGYCISPYRNLPEALKEYQRLTGFKNKGE